MRETWIVVFVMAISIFLHIAGVDKVEVNEAKETSEYPVVCV